MPATASPQQGHGVAITFSSGFLAYISSVAVSGINRAALETTNSSTTTARTFIPEKLANYGEIRVSLMLNTAADPLADADRGNDRTQLDRDGFHDRV
mgnify:CR=1 FL=1